MLSRTFYTARVLLGVTLAVFAVSIGGAAQAGVYRLSAGAGATISQASPDKPVGYAGTLSVGGADDQHLSKVYLQFPLVWLNGKVRSAVLQLTPTPGAGSSGEVHVWGFDFLYPVDPGSLAWNNAPGSSRAGAGLTNTAATDLGTLAPPDPAKPGGVEMLSSDALSAYVAANAGKSVTLTLFEEAGGQHCWQSPYIPENPGAVPILTVTTDSAQSIDLTLPDTITVAPAARQTLRGFGSGAGDPGFQRLSADQKLRLSTVLWKDTHQQALRIWADMAAISPAPGKVDLSGILSGYFNSGLYDSIRAAGVKILLLAPSGLPSYMLDTTPSPAAAGQLPFTDSGILQYADEIANIIITLKNKYGVTIDATGIANECVAITPPQWPIVVKRLRADLDAAGRTDVRIIAPEWPNNDGWAWARMEAIKQDPEAWKALFAVCTHSYAMACAESFYDEFSGPSGKEYWMDESEGSSGQDLAAHLLNDVNHGVTLWMYHESVLGCGTANGSCLLGYDLTGGAKSYSGDDFIIYGPRYSFYKQIADTFDVGAHMRYCSSNSVGDMQFGARMNAAAGQNPDGTWAAALVNNTQGASGRAVTAQIAIPELAAVEATSMQVVRSGSGRFEVREPPIVLRHGIGSIALGPGELVTLRSGGAPSSPAAGSPTATAAFVKSDSDTQGLWKHVYGSDGYYIAGDGSAANPRIPAYATFTAPQAFPVVWEGPVDGGNEKNHSDLRVADPGARVIGSAFLGPDGVGLDIGLTDGKAHMVSVYLLDWDGDALKHRAETIEVLDAATGAVLDTRRVSKFSGGVYLSWRVTGHVLICATYQDGDSAVISAVFFDPPPRSVEAGSQPQDITGANQGAQGGVDTPADPDL